MIYNLTTSDITSSGNPVKYKCGVTNVRLFETLISNVEFTLNSTGISNNICNNHHVFLLEKKLNKNYLLKWLNCLL